MSLEITTSSPQVLSALRFSLGNSFNSVPSTLSIQPFVGNNSASGHFSSILGGQNNDTNHQPNTFILGSNITASLSGYTYVQNLSSLGCVQTIGGNSDNWNTGYTTVNTNSSNWNTAYTQVLALSSQLQQSATVSATNVLNWNSVYTTVNKTSANWGVGINVKDFGATGDGVTNDYTAINAALARVVSLSGGVLHFPAGTYRITTKSHALHITSGQNNITITGDDNSVILIDNMNVDGSWNYHGIFVEGPVSNIAIRGLHVKYSSIAAYRQGTAPIYFLGANLGVGDGSAVPWGWYRGSSDGSERPDLIAAGAVKNVWLENITVENSPSVGIGLVGVDGIVERNIKVIQTWADGLYHVNFRRAKINSAVLLDIGDDAISMASYESDINNANIENDFHGEGSTVSDVTIEGQAVDPSVPCGSLVCLGIRDVTFSNYVIRNRFRGIRFENGTQITLDYPNLALNFLANRRVTIEGVTLSNCTQALAFTCKEVNFSTNQKWWLNDVSVTNVVAENCGDNFDPYAPGIPQNGGESEVLIAGFKFENLSFSGTRSTFSTIRGAYKSTFKNLSFDNSINIQGSVPAGADPDLTDSGIPRYWESLSVFDGIRGDSITFAGLKRCYITNIESTNAPQTGIFFISCSDIDFGTLRVLYPNRLNLPYPSAVGIDRTCRRVSGNEAEITWDNNTIGSTFSIQATDSCFVRDVRIETVQNQTSPLLSDALSLNKQSQVRRAVYNHKGSGLGWIEREYPAPPTTLNVIDTDTAVVLENTARVIRYANPLTANRTVTLWESSAVYGDRCEVTRLASCTGAYTIDFKGQVPGTSGFPEVRASLNIGLVNGDSTGQISSLKIGAIEILGSTIGWVTSNTATAAAICTQINTHGSGFTATAIGSQIFLQAPVGSGSTYNGTSAVLVTSGNISFNNFDKMNNGAAAGVAGEVAASTVFFIRGGTAPTGHTGTISSVAVNGHNLLTTPVTWTANNANTAYLVANAINSNPAALSAYHVQASSSADAVILKAAAGFGASANSWTLAVTPTGDISLSDVNNFSGGANAPVATTQPSPYEIFTSQSGQPFHVVFEYGPAGWEVISLQYPRLAYGNGAQLLDTTNLYNSLGNVIADQWGNLVCANGSVLAYSGGQISLGTRFTPITSTAFGVPMQIAADANYLYICITASGGTYTWKRVALSSF